MADEITYEAKISIENGTFKDTFKLGRLQIDQAAIGQDSHTQTIPTSDTVITVVAGVATLGWAAFQNTDETNYVEIGPTSAGAIVPFLRLNAGEYAIMRLAQGITLRGLANGASVKLRVWLLNN